MTEDEFISNLARDAYHAYCHDAVWTSVKGDPLPQWEETTKEVQQHWKVATLHIVRVARNSETP
jgi:hypothetical protein